MQRHGGVDLAKHGLEAVAQLSVPRQKRRALVHVRGLVDLVLLEPEGHAPGRVIVAAAGEASALQPEDRVQQPAPLVLRHGRHVSADAVAKSHHRSSSLWSGSSLVTVYVTGAIEGVRPPSHRRPYVSKTRATIPRDEPSSGRPPAATLVPRCMRPARGPLPLVAPRGHARY